jgi:hypothetical protein
VTRSRGDLKLYSQRATTDPDLKGIWVNELQSVMTIARVEAGVFRGEYESAVSGEHSPVKGKLIGTIAGDSLGFTVNWEPDFDSVTSWSGKLLVDEDGALSIYTLWQLSRPVEESEDWWQSILAGSDMFRKE